MGLREAIPEFLACDEATARSAFRGLLSDCGLGPDRLPRTPSAAAPPASVADADDLTDRDRRLIGRVRLLDDAPLGVTLCGPAYRDTPIVYANRTFRELTGYSLAELRGRNPRLLQGPKTSDSAVADLREAVSIWEPVTVELWNHRRDGTSFLNRVSLRPLPGDDGTVTHWVAVQEAVDGSDGRR